MEALILVDLQNDFCPGGALAVRDGNEVIPVANRLMKRFDLVVATQDWHPAGHGSFASVHGKRPGEVIQLNGLKQVLWPDHCVQGSAGAGFVAGLDMKGIHKIFVKGTDPGIDSYSGFYDNGHKKATGLGDYLKGKGVSAVTVMGLATDYCVRFTALDAVSLGLKTTLALAGSRGVDLAPGDIDKAIEEMRERGINIDVKLGKEA